MNTAFDENTPVHGIETIGQDTTLEYKSTQAYINEDDNPNLNENNDENINHEDEDVKKKRLPLELLERGLSELGPSPDTLGQVYKKLSIINAGLTDISGLQGYKYIQTLILAGNGLTDISCLGEMRYLVRLNVSNNKLTSVLDFDPQPFNLQEIDFSRNYIIEIRDLSENRFLKSACFDENMIRKITGLHKCQYLTHLSLAKNFIATLENLDGLPIKHLNLRHNYLETVDGIKNLQSLEQLDLSLNRISDLSPFSISDYPYLRSLDLSTNKITNPHALIHLIHIPHLTSLSLRDNPITYDALIAGGYRLSTSFILQRLNVLDGVVVSCEEKVAAVNLFNPPPAVVASVQNAAMVKRQAKLYARIKAADLMRATRLRPIVLCGPNGVGKRTLTQRLINEFPHIFGLSVSHTTRLPRAGEENGVHYHFVNQEEMEEMMNAGKLIELVTLFGFTYGTSMESIDKVTEEGKVCIMDLEMEGVLALKRSHLKPRYIYITVPSLEILQARLQGRFDKDNKHLQHHGGTDTRPSSGFQEHHSIDPNHTNTVEPQRPSSSSSQAPDVERWVHKAHMLKEEDYELDEDFFDLKIVNDDQERAYQQLKEFCMNEYIKSYNEDET